MVVMEETGSTEMKVKILKRNKVFSVMSNR